MRISGNIRRLYRFGAYRFWRRRLKGHVQQLGQEQAYLVDCGCGGGYLLPYLCGWFPNLRVVGIDMSVEVLRMAVTRYPEKSLGGLIAGSADTLPLPDRSTEVMVAFHVVEHLPEPRKFLEEAHRVLRPGGLLLVATPNLGSIGAKVMRRYWNGYKDPTHISLKSATEWKELVEERGFVISSWGTTSLGIPILRQITWGPLLLKGFMPWKLGDSFMCIAQRK